MNTWTKIENAPSDMGMLVGKRVDDGYNIDFVIKNQKGFCYDLENDLYLAYEPTHFKLEPKPNF